MHLFCLLPLLAFVSARNITIVTKTNSTFYAESETKKDTIGYNFAINQNVLSVMLNATESAENIDPVSYMIIPNLLLEYNSTENANSTDSIFGFQDKNSVVGSWGKGLSATKYKSKALNGTESVDVWQVRAEWSNPNAKNKKPKFNALMYFSSAATEFHGKRLSPNAINIRYSILNYPFKYQNSTLGLNELVLSKGNIATNLFSNSTDDNGDGDYGSLRVNRTALVDGKKKHLVVDHYDGSSIDIVAGNSTNIDLSEFDKQSVLFSVRDVSGAKNVTIDQRLSLNITALRKEAEKKGNNKEETASPNNSNKSGAPLTFMAFVIALTSVLVSLPALVL
ncbi:hypothetical protein PSACC_01293 [Paramicrosporidium saccamoebae]|uniref:Uncharacterized protein n=1 Tax=Paramicrosporidium saccamoebae TaxID=1246581 RepID=A0A2H9TMC0_9FUNG|nr:hypothetical protein PSACC_01293 [Paramicrosporidium saccamoebae]